MPSLSPEQLAPFKLSTSHVHLTGSATFSIFEDSHEEKGMLLGKRHAMTAFEETRARSCGPQQTDLGADLQRIPAGLYAAESDPADHKLALRNSFLRLFPSFERELSKFIHYATSYNAEASL